VISASDDLHAMRAEMEEASPGKRSISQSAADNSSVWHSRWQTLSAVIAPSASLGFTSESRHEVVAVTYSLTAAPSILPPGRAPPLFFLA